MTKEELHNHIKNVSEDYISKSWNSFLDLDETDLILAGIGVGKIIANEQEKRIAELELKIKHLTEHLEPQAMTALFEQVEEEVKQEQRLNELEKENSLMNQIILGNEEEITDLRKDCMEYSKTFNRQNNEIISLRKKMIEAKEIIEGLMRFCRCFAQHHTEDIRYKEAEQFLNEV